MYSQQTFPPNVHHSNFPKQNNHLKMNFCHQHLQKRLFSFPNPPKCVSYHSMSSSNSARPHSNAKPRHCRHSKASEVPSAATLVPPVSPKRRRSRSHSAPKTWTSKNQKTAGTLDFGECWFRRGFSTNSLLKRIGDILECH